MFSSLLFLISASVGALKGYNVGDKVIPRPNPTQRDEHGQKEVGSDRLVSCCCRLGVSSLLPSVAHLSLGVSCDHLLARSNIVGPTCPPRIHHLPRVRASPATNRTAGVHGILTSSSCVPVVDGRKGLEREDTCIGPKIQRERKSKHGRP
jgi:hypothetical protein